MSAPTMPVVAAPWEGLGDGTVGTLVPRVRTGARRSRTRRAVPATVLLSDAVALCASVLVVAWVVPPTAGPGSLGRYGFGLLSWSVVMAVLAARGTYRVTRRHIAPRVADDLTPLVVSLALGGLCLLAIDAVAPFRDRLPADDVVLVLLASLVLVPVCRSAGILAASTRPANVARVVVVGSDEVARGLVRRLSCSRLVEVIGVVDDEPAGGQEVLGPVEDLPRICEDRHVDRVVIAFSQRHPSRSAQVLLSLQGEVDIDVVARYYELMSWESRLSDVTGLSLLSVGRHAGRWSAAVKRALDVAVAATGLALLGPLLLAVAVAVRIRSGSPVLFRQTRVGRGERPFRIVKFRTMRPVPGSEGSPGSPGRDGPDARSPLDVAPDPTLVTGLGRRLRRTGLDELPQLVNVLRGEMSLVGPRPFVPEECAGLQSWSRRRFDVRPGMTGMWQVCGQHEVSLDELCRLDVQYATSWTLRSDLRVLARTPGRLIRGSAPGR